MAYPSIYNVTYSYTGFQQSQGNNAFPGTQIDADLAGLQSTVSNLSTFMKSVMRSDGALNNNIVTYDSLAPALQLAGLGPADAWLTATGYLVGKNVVQSTNLYRCLIPHTSGVFATDLAAGKWVFVTAVTAGPTGPAGGQGLSGTLAVNSVTTLAPGSPATVVNVGTPQAASLNISLPQGANGIVGPNGAGYAATSSTSLLIANSVPKAFTTQTGLAYQVGDYARAKSAANGANFMEGLVTSYAAGVLTIQVSKIGGSGTFADWNISLTGAPGAGDLLSTNNLSDVASVGTAIRNLGGFDLSTTVPVTTTTTLTTSGFGKLHLLSGTAANYTVTLPTPVGNTGAMMAFMVDLPANASKLYTLSTPAGVIGRQGAGFIMWASETVVLRSDGTNWQVLDGRPVPFSGKLTRITDQTGFTGTFANLAFTAAAEDPSGLNLCFAGGVFTAPRKGTYCFTAHLYATQTGGTFLQSTFSFNGTSTGVVPQFGTAQSGTMTNFGQRSAAAGDAISIQLRGDGTSLTAAAATVSAEMTYLEAPTW